MQTRNKLIIAVPCFNEEENIPALVEGFQKTCNFTQAYFDTELVFIDDFSNDKTKDSIQKFINRPYLGLEIHLICHEENLGLAGGLRTAFKYFSLRIAKDTNILACGIMDGDNSHNPGHIPSMIESILKGFDVSICSRFQKESRTLGVVWWRQILSLGMSILFKTIRNIPGARDYSCGYRLYSSKLCLRLWSQYKEKIVTEENFACMVELLLRCHKAGALITEVPMLLRYDLKKGCSKMKFIKTISGTIRVLIR